MTKTINVIKPKNWDKIRIKAIANDTTLGHIINKVIDELAKDDSVLMAKILEDIRK